MPFLISCSGSKSIAAYDPYSNVILQTYSAGVTPQNCLTAAESGIYSAQANSSLIMVHKYHHLAADYRSAVAAEVSALISSKKLIFAGHANGAVSIWDSVSGILLAHRDNLAHSAILCLDLGNDDQILYLGSKNGSLSAFSVTELLNPKTNSVSALAIAAGNNQSIIGVKAFSGNKVSIASIDGFLQIFELPIFANIFDKGAKKIKTFIKVKNINLGFAISSFTLSPNQTLAFCGLKNGKILPVKLFDGKIAEEVALKNFHSSAVTSIRFSEDGAHFLSGDENGEVYFWNVNSCQISQKTSFSGPVTNIVLAFPAKVFASSSNLSHQKLVFPNFTEAKSLQKYQKAPEFDEIIEDSMKLNVPAGLAKKLGISDEMFNDHDITIDFSKENIEDADEKVVISKQKLINLERSAALAASLIDNFDSYL